MRRALLRSIPPEQPPLPTPRCPACGRNMRLALIQPKDKTTDLHSYDCACGHERVDEVMR